MKKRKLKDMYKFEIISESQSDPVDVPKLKCCCYSCDKSLSIEDNKFWSKPSIKENINAPKSHPEDRMVICKDCHIKESN